MDITQLEYFISLVNHMNFTKAAQSCNVVQGTISRQISNLEKELGAELFDRNSHGVKLTPAGDILRVYAPVFVEYHRNILNQVRNAAQGIGETIRIGIGPMEQPLLRQPLKTFHQMLPSVSVNLMTYTYEILQMRYRNNVLDLCFCNERCAGEMENYEKIEIFAKPWQVAAAESQPFWLMEREDQERLSNATVITLINDQYEPVREYCRERQFQHCVFSETNFFSAQLELLRSGIGIALLPPFLKTSMPPEIRMEPVLKEPLLERFYLCYNPETISPKARVFLELFQLQKQGKQGML